METRSATRRSVRLNKVKPPRPRRSISEPAAVSDDPNIKIIESLHQKLIDGVTCHTDVAEFLGHANTCGQQMELQLKDRLDGLFDVIRLSMVESQMEACTRMHMLQLLELRAGGWQIDESRNNFYKHKCKCLGMKGQSNSDIGDISIKKTSVPKPNGETSNIVTHDKAAGDTVTLSKMPDVFDVSDTMTHAKTSTLYGGGEPQSNTRIIPPPPGLHRCMSVPQDGASGSDFSRFRSLSDRCFSEAMAMTIPPPPWRCNSSVLELSHMGNNMRERTCSTSPEPDLEQECITYAVEVLLSYSESPLAREPPKDWSYLSKVFPGICFTEVDHYFDVNTYKLPQWHFSMPHNLTRQDVDASSAVDRGGFPCTTRQDVDASSAIVRGFPCTKRQDVDASSAIVRGFPCTTRQGINTSSAFVSGGFPGNTRQDVDTSSAVVSGGFPCSTKQDVSSAIIRGGFPGNTKQDVDVSSTIVRAGFPGITKKDVDISSTVVRGAFPGFTKPDVDVSSAVTKRFQGFTNQSISSSLVKGFPG